MNKAALLLLASLSLSGQQPQIYRWKDRSGREHVTNTPPPPDATPLSVPPLENTKEPEAKPVPTPHPAPGDSLPPKPLSREQDLAWKATAQRLAEARGRGDVQVLESTADSILQEALWGNGAWALVLLPLTTLALVTLLGWWLASGLQRPLALALTLLFGLVGLGLAHLCLAHFVYRLQAQRLVSAVSALKQHLGTAQGPSPESLRKLDARLLSLEPTLQPSAPPWRFPQEVRTLGEVLRQVVVNP